MGTYPQTMDRGDGIDRDANGYDYAAGITSCVARQQRVLNESWPELATDGTRHARNIHPAKHPDGTPWTIDVNVRVELSDDGEVILPGRAERWNASHVFVVVDDDRLPGHKVWVLAGDVRRR